MDALDSMQPLALTFVAEPPARGAGLNQVIGLTIAAMVLSVLMLWIGWAHRTRRIGWLAKFGDWLGVKFKRPSWVALPILVYTSSIICALFGFIWDVSWHIGNGRDPGPLANPAHYFIIIGLFGVFVGGNVGRRAAVRQARSGAGAHHQQLACARGRRADGRVRALRDRRVPSRRHLAPHLRAGCHALGPNAFDDDRWRWTLPVLGTHARVRGRAGTAGSTRRASLRQVPALPILRRFADRLVGLSDRIRLRRRAVPAGVAADDDRRRRVAGVGRGPHDLGPRRSIGGGVVRLALRGGVALLVGPILGAPHNWFPLYLWPGGGGRVARP